MKYGQLAALAALGALTAGMWQLTRDVAHADPPPPPPNNEQLFLDAVHAAGFDKPDNIALRDGLIVCAADYQNGVSDDLVQRGIAAAQRWLNHPADPALDAAFNDAAQKFLCP